MTSALRPLSPFPSFGAAPDSGRSASASPIVTLLGRNPPAFGGRKGDRAAVPQEGANFYARDYHEAGT